VANDTTLKKKTELWFYYYVHHDNTTAKGFTDSSGKFHPTSDDSSGVSSEQVESKESEPQMDVSKAEELKKKNQ